MNYLVLMVVDNLDYVPEILSAWEKAGVLGVTILDSTGLGRIRRSGLRDDLPLMPSLSDLLQNEEIHHRTLFSVVDSQEVVDRMVAIVENIVGDLDEPHTGFMFVVPVVHVYGMGKHRMRREEE
jgi:nitrogen regulatory protein P-II 1